ncbi:uncharacterized protein FIESC28_05082 [Fusarium coffeatum]|uniref:WSC domain-containing protein n=1 Tax=Fusarium coffeatum TaxID=231269 RepID=A0A366RWY8_9HYPO|nr:uncharacterized protein FIESC28_05082 [Fusarium coffeatum]RBR20930.1 hypothetical protein FIESC28_05082 [Fusarium coffeatum]
MARLIFAYVTLLLWVALVAAQYDYHHVLKGCYQVKPHMSWAGGYARTQQEREKCAIVCSQKNLPFVGFGTTNCFCARVEPSNNKVDISRCEAVGLDGWNAPKTRKADFVEDEEVLLFFDTSIPRSIPIGCFQGLPEDAHLTEPAISKPERLACATSCDREGKAAVVFAGRKCGCIDSIPDVSNRVEDISCGLEPSAEPSRSEQFYSVWTAGRRFMTQNYEFKINGLLPFEQEGLDYQLFEKEGTTTELAEQYEGPRQACYRNPPDENINKFKEFPDNNPTLCYRFCEQYDMKYIFLRDTGCWCSNTYPPKKDVYLSGWCKWECPRNPFAQCGGEKAFSVYNLKPWMSPASPASPARTSEQQTRQCFSIRPTKASEMLGYDGGEECLERCKEVRKPLAVMHGSYCWCASKYPHTTYKLDLDSCDLPCENDNGTYCGGNDGIRPYYSTYRTGMPGRIEHHPSQRRFDTPIQDETTWHGCWNKPPTRRYGSYAESNTVKGCANFCRRSGFPVAAVQDHNCICGDSYPPLEQRSPESSCNTSCPGFEYATCGGPQAWNVLNTGLKTDVPYDESDSEKKNSESATVNQKMARPDLLGCYNTHFITARDRVYLRHDQVNGCARRCKSRGKPISALQKDTCLCADALPHKDSQVDNVECDTPCQDPSNEKCGGPRYWSVYNSGLQTSLATDLNMKPAYGCFKYLRYADETNKLVRIHLHGSGGNRSGDSCTTRCAEKGFPVALRLMSACSCSHELPVMKYSLPSESCSYKCPKDPLEMCGGPDSAYTVYKTDAYVPDLHTEEKPNDEKHKGNDPGASPDSRPQCLEPAWEKAYDIFNVVSDKAAGFAQKIQDGFFWVRDKGQELFDICLWNIIVFFSNIMYGLGLWSSEGNIDL